jgi:hypothetical protein
MILDHQLISEILGEFSQFLDDILSPDQIMFVELITHEIYERIVELEER